MCKTRCEYEWTTRQTVKVHAFISYCFSFISSRIFSNNFLNELHICCTRTLTHIQCTNACLLFMLCCLSTFTYLLFSLYLKITGINTATERQWQRAKNERRVTTATIDVRKATDGIDDDGSDVNLTERKHTHTHIQRRTRLTDQESKSAWESAADKHLST